MDLVDFFVLDESVWITKYQCRYTESRFRRIRLLRPMHILSFKLDTGIIERAYGMKILLELLGIS